MSDHHHSDEPSVYGMIAEFDDEDLLIAAVDKAYAAGYRDMDAYTPFPIHGLSEKLGFKKTMVAPVTLLGGLAGATFGFGMQYFAMAVHYQYEIGGKPLNSWPSYLVITFELMILFAGFSAFFGMWLMNGLPRPHHPIFNAKRFERASSDGFFLCIEVTDGQYDTDKVQTFLQDLGPVEVSEVPA